MTRTRRLWWRFLAWRYRRMSANLLREVDRLSAEGYAGLARPTHRMAQKYDAKAQAYAAAGRKSAMTPRERKP